MKKLVVDFNDTGLSFEQEGRMTYITEDKRKYTLGLNLQRDQVQSIKGGIENGGQTFIYVKE